MIGRGHQAQPGFALEGAPGPAKQPTDGGAEAVSPSTSGTRAAPDKLWSPAEVGRALVTGEAPAAAQLERLRVHRLAVDVDGRYRYAPPTDHEATVDALAEWFARRRHTIIGLIYGTGERSAATLADAFRLRRPEC